MPAKRGRPPSFSRDELLAALLRAGFSIEQGTRALDFVTEIVWANVRSSTDMPSKAGRDAFLAEINRLDVHEVPTLRQSVEVRENTSIDMQFEYDLACALAGIGARSSVTR